MELYQSKHFKLLEIRQTGKKEIRGILCFKGLPSVYGSPKKILALEDGIVLKAGRSPDIHSREHRLGTIVTITGHNGVTITYGRLSHRTVNEGDRVKKGQVIGIEGSSGTGPEEYLTLEFRRNGRRIDGCDYLDINPVPSEFNPPYELDSEVVCRVCGIGDRIRTYINSCPDCDELWSKVRRQLEYIK